jgi:5-methylcytosine-specific restriction endonuclease McrA
MTYSQRLRDPRWQKKRLQILERDNWACRCCGTTTKTINVHHVVYVRGKDPWDYKDDSYQTLCNDCHRLRGDIADVAANILRSAMAQLTTEEMMKLSGDLTLWLFKEGK